MKQLPAIILIAGILWGCGTGSGTEVPEHIRTLENLEIYSVDQPADTVVLTPEARFGDSEEAMVAAIGGVEVDDLGRVYLSDSRLDKIHIFEPDGSFIKSIGGEGKGPGEFNYISTIRIKNGNLYARDGRLNRINLFSTETHEFTGTLSLDNQQWSSVPGLNNYRASRFYPLNNGNLLFRFQPNFNPESSDSTRTVKYYTINPEGDITSGKLLELTDSERFINQGESIVMILTSSYHQIPRVVISGKDQIYATESRDFLVKVYSPDGTYERAFYYRYPNAPLSKNEIIADAEGNEQYQDMIRKAELPETWPAIANMQIDDLDRLWIEVNDRDKNTAQWWVLDSNGKLLAKMSVPDRNYVRLVKNNFLYMREGNEETGITEIVKYAISLE